MLDELFYEYDFNDVDYCQSVINSATLIKQNHYELTDESVNNVLKYHDAKYQEWCEDCTRYNDPVELLKWLGH